MSNINTEELDTWVAEVELAHQYINDLKDGKISVEDLDRKDKEKIKEKQRLEEKKLEKERQLIEQKKQGRSGKGERENYYHFCKFCFWEYELPTPDCLRCGKATMNYTERRADLMVKAEAYKKSKLRREERKKKWELWKKTKAMLWKKTSTNYSKWDYFTSSSESEQEDADPIVPKNDPNFQALEKDLEERAQRRKESRAKAETWKIKGNEFLQKQNYQQAAEMYTKGLEEIKDYKALYTNRALAYLHLGKFQPAIKDCEQVLEYCECFEDGYEKSRDTCFKACLRKAVALKELKKFQQANESVKEARTLIVKNEEARKLQEEIEFILKHEKAAQQIKEQQKEQEDQELKQKEEEQKIKEEQKEDQIEEDKGKVQESKSGKQQLSYKEQVDLFIKLEEFKKDDMNNLQICFKQYSEAKIYFYESKGIQKFLAMLKKNIDCYSLMNEFFDNNIYYQTEFAKATGLVILLKRINENLDKCKDNKQLYDEIEEILELLVTFSLQEQLREWFKTDIKFIPPLLEKASAHLLINLNQEPNVLSSYFSLLGNIVYGGQQCSVTKFIHEHKVLFFSTIQNILSIFRARQKFLLLKKHTLTFLSNLLTNKQMREDIALETEIIGYLVYNLTKLNLDNSDFLWISPAESLLAVFSNLTFEADNDLITQLQKFKLGAKVQTFLVDVFKLYSKSIDKLGLVIARGMQIIVRIQLKKEELSEIFCDWLFKCFEKEFISNGIAAAAIKVFIKLMSDNKYFITQSGYQEKYKVLAPKLHQFIITQPIDEALFCNTCSLLKLIVQQFPSLIMGQKAVIQTLIDICKDKLGKIRKNAAILLATLAKNSEEMLEFVRELHGMQVLQNVSQFIIE